MNRDLTIKEGLANASGLFRRNRCLRGEARACPERAAEPALSEANGRRRGKAIPSRVCKILTR